MRPNFLFIMADQMAAPALLPYGDKIVKAPTIDRLAAEGTVFENAYCNLPMCGPSRASLHAGRMPFSIRMYDNASEFMASIPTFAHYLRDLDYQVELAGKMHFVGPDQLHGYHKRHTTEIYPANFAWTVDWSKGREYRPTNLTMAPIIESGSCVRTLQMDYDDEVAYHGVQAIYDLARRQTKDPWMLTVSFTHPHSPFVIADEFWNLYNHDDIPLPKVAPLGLDAMDHLSRNLHYCQARDHFTVTDEHSRTAKHAYYGMISYIDSKVAALQTALKRSGMAEETIIVFTADHGEMMGERGMWYKQHFFEWAAHIPLIMHAPTRWKPSRVSQNCSLIDIMPTLLDLANEKPFTDYVSPIDGTSLVPALMGDISNMNDLVISEFAADGSTGPSRMVKRGSLKYMDLEGVDTVLYDLANDPNELNNLINHPDYQGAAAELKQLCEADWDRAEMYDTIAADQKQRLKVHHSTNGEPSYVNIVRSDDANRYIRNAGAADTKARARLPYVPPAQPDT
ncbi:MAG: choline-sulfatase [Candidatus Puniceispirillum sp.]|nr:choline-sulfatase [Candidatus Puniceispirillum sp.]